MFGIQAGVRLYGAARQAYVDRTRERAMTLPLPGIDHQVDLGQAQSWFLVNPAGQRTLLASRALRELHERILQAPDRDTWERESPELARDYVQAFLLAKSTEDGVTSEGLAPVDILALQRIEQWRSGDAPHPSALQRIAGTVVEVGIDWFSSGPGRITGETGEKRLLRALLEALDDQSFATEGLERVVENLLLSTLDTLGEHPELASGDPKAQQLVAALAKGLTADVQARLEKLPPEQRLFEAEQLSATAGLVFRSLLRHGAGAALANPRALLGVGEDGEAALVTRVGTALLDTLLPDAQQRFDLRGVFAQDSLDRVARAALGVVAEHPELLHLDGGDLSGLQRMLQEVARGLHDSTAAVGPDLLPELLRLVLERTAANLHLMWRPEDESQHLLLAASRILLQSLAKSAGPAVGGEPGPTWGRILSRRQVLTLVEDLLDEVAENPALVTAQLGGNPALQTAVEAVLQELASRPLDQISPRTIAEILRAAVHAAALRADFFEKWKGGGGKTRTALGHVLDAVLQAAFRDPAGDARVGWVLARASTLEALTAAALEVLAEHGVDAARVAVLRETLTDVVTALEKKQTFSVGAFATLLGERLAA